MVSLRFQLPWIDDNATNSHSRTDQRGKRHTVLMEPPLNRYFGRKPTSVTSESNVRIGESAMPWEREGDGGKLFKYQYHPHGDRNQPLRNAPSALNSVIVPNVTLPKVRLIHRNLTWRTRIGIR